MDMTPEDADLSSISKANRLCHDELCQLIAGSSFYIVRKVGINPKNGGNSNFCFLCGFVNSGVAAVDDAQGAGMGNPIVHL